MNEELKKQIENCSRCGLCMDVCPVYKAKKTETSVSRGKFLQLLGLIKKELQYDKKIKYNLDLCLNCKKCQKSCPSDIDAVKIFARIKEEYNSPYENFLNSRFVFKLKMFCLKVFYKIKYPIGKMQRKNKQEKPAKEKIAYFKGCVENAVNKARFPYKTEKEKFLCCGLPFYTKGRIDLYEKNKKKNIELIKKYDKVVFNCATCYDTVLNYENVNREKLIYFTDFYKNKKLKSKIPLKITFHKPCHLDENKFFEIENLISNIEGVSYQRAENYSDCCGFGGDFFTRHINTASFLSFAKLDGAIKTGSNVILTTCPVCLWSLKYAIKIKRAKIKAYDLADFLYNFVDFSEVETVL